MGDEKKIDRQMSSSIIKILYYIRIWITALAGYDLQLK